MKVISGLVLWTMSRRQWNLLTRDRDFMGNKNKFHLSFLVSWEGPVKQWLIGLRTFHAVLCALRATAVVVNKTGETSGDDSGRQMSRSTTKMKRQQMIGWKTLVNLGGRGLLIKTEKWVFEANGAKGILGIFQVALSYGLLYRTRVVCLVNVYYCCCYKRWTKSVRLVWVVSLSSCVRPRVWLP